MRTGPLAAAAWVVAAALTLGVSWSAVQVVRSAVAPEDLTAAGDRLPVPTEPGGSPSTTTSASRPTAVAPTDTTPVADTASRSGVGGSVVVRCVDGVPRLVSRIPKQGFMVEVDDSPGEVKFSSDRHRTEIKATCAGGKPQLTVEEDDRGGNSGRGGGNDG